MKILSNRSAVLAAALVTVGGALTLMPTGPAAAAAAGDRLAPDTQLNAEECAKSASGAFEFCMQGDGNLVLYRGAHPLWATNTYVPGSTAGMQGDGNLVVYDPTGRPLWASRTARYPGAYLVVQDDGNVAIYRPNGESVWATHTEAPHPIVHTGEELPINQFRLSGNQQYRFVMQGDGNLVLYGSDNQPRWASNTSVAGSTAWMQADGNLVIYNPAGEWVWDSKTDLHNGARLAVQDDGNVVIYDTDNSVLWSTGIAASAPAPPAQPAAPAPADPAPAPAAPPPPAATPDMQPDQELHAGQQLESPNKKFRLVMQGDGNLVLYRDGEALWASDTDRYAGASAAMQGDGNLVVYAPDGRPRWASNTARYPGAHLALQDDGNLVIYTAGGTAVWASHTEPKPAPVAPPPPAPALRGGWSAFTVPGAAGSNPYSASTVTYGWTDRARWVMDQVRDEFSEIYMCGGASDGSNSGHVSDSYHYSGNALDCYVGPGGEYPSSAQRAQGDRITAWLIANADRLKVEQVIWCGQIWTWDSRGAGWQVYADRGDITLNHYDHFHISIARPGDGR